MDKILKYFADNKLLVNIIILSIVLIGLYNSSQLKQDLFPLASLDQLVITVIYPGAAPEDVELNAVIPIERKIKKIRGIKDYTSFSVENMGRIVVSVEDDVDNVQQIKDDIFRELENVPDLADEVEDVSIFDANPKLRSIYEIGVKSKKDHVVSDKTLYSFVDELEENLLNLPDVSDIYKDGHTEREIHINVIPQKMSNYYISFNDIIQSIKTRNVRVTGGTLQSVHEDKTIISIGQFEDPMDVKEVIIRSNFEENRVRIKDIAKVKDSFKKKNIEVKINTIPGVSLRIVKKSNSDVVRTVKNVKKYLSAIKDDVPEGLEIIEIYDDSRSISSLLKIVKQNAFIGFLLVFLVLLLFLRDLRTSFWTAFGIPITILITLTYMKLAGFSINIITLGALITVMGMLVDHGIVISDIIFEYKSKGYSPVDAAIKGVMDVIAPVSITIITTIVAFIPMFYIKGMMGKFIYVFPSVIICALVASFIEATIILPNHLSQGKIKRLKDRKSSKNWFDPVAKFYQKLLMSFLKFRYFVVLFFIFIFIMTIVISIEPIKNFILLDDKSSDQVFIKLEAPQGTSLQKNTELTEKIEKIIYETLSTDELVSIKTVIGHHKVKGLKHKGNHENWALVSINLVPLTNRTRTADDIMNTLRKK